jgi:hypothetical protein
MKRKKLKKKLALHKTTIADLDHKEMGYAVGGQSMATICCQEYQDTGIELCMPFHHTDFDTCQEGTGPPPVTYTCTCGADQTYCGANCTG